MSQIAVPKRLSGTHGVSDHGNPKDLTSEVAKPVITPLLAELYKEASNRGRGTHTGVLTMGASYLCPSQRVQATNGFIEQLH